MLKSAAPANNAAASHEPHTVQELVGAKPSNTKSRRVMSVAAKLAVSTVLIWLALRGVDFASVGRHLAAADMRMVLAGFAITAAISLIHADRWQVILRDIRCRVRYGIAWRWVLIGYFFNQTLPSTVGGDAFRAWGIYRHGVPGEDAFAS